MDENTGNQPQPASVNQPTQSTQTQPTPNVAQQTTQTGQVTRSFSQQPQINQQPTVTQTNNGDQPKSSKKKILIIIAGLIVIVLILIMAFVSLSQKPSSEADKPIVTKPTQVTESQTKILKPTYISAGFAEQETIQTGTYETGERFYIVDFISQDGRRYSFQLIEDSDVESLVCVKPEEGVTTTVSNYQDFLPSNSVAGCSVTVGEGTSNEMRSHKWLIENRKFLINSHNSAISDSEALQIANSLQEQVVQ